MTTETQIEANRANAAKSTGPRTEDGKRRASGNARRHGLSQPPPRSEVMAWYEVITGRALDPELLPRSDEEHAALALAEAEAHLANAMREEERFLEALETGEQLEVQLRDVWKVVITYGGRIPRVSPKGRNLHLLAWARNRNVRKEKITMKWTRPDARHEGIARYRKEAEVRRHKALQAWIEILRQQAENPKRTQMRA